MQKRNLIVIIAVLVLALTVAVAALLWPKTVEAPADVNLAAKGYVHISAGDQTRWFELPQEETSMTLRRTDEAGNEISNTVALTPEGAYMAHSTCENQDCVMQGSVTLANKGSRPLQNLVICLPNNVIVELYSAEEMAQLLAAQE